MTNQSLNDILQRFADANCSWLTTVWPDCRPHSAPVWHVWTNSRVYVVTVLSAVKVANIDHNPYVVLTHPDPHSAIIIDGKAKIVSGMEDELRPLFKAKYDWDIATDDAYNTIIEITPEKVLAWGEEGAGHRQRWRGEEIVGLA
jgi:general stress protein 26